MRNKHTRTWTYCPMRMKNQRWKHSLHKNSLMILSPCMIITEHWAPGTLSCWALQSAVPIEALSDARSSPKLDLFSLARLPSSFSCLNLHIPSPWLVLLHSLFIDQVSSMKPQDENAWSHLALAQMSQSCTPESSFSFYWQSSAPLSGPHLCLFVS